MVKMSKKRDKRLSNNIQYFIIFIAGKYFISITSFDFKNNSVGFQEKILNFNWSLKFDAI